MKESELFPESLDCSNKFVPKKPAESTDRSNYLSKLTEALTVSINLEAVFDLFDVASVALAMDATLAAVEPSLGLSHLVSLFFEL
jgi:hypothetical protein